MIDKYICSESIILLSIDYILSVFQVNNVNDHFPILGICLGFELLLMASIKGKFPFSKCNAQDLNLPLILVPGMEEKSVLFRNMPKDIQKILLTKPVTANHHLYVLINYFI